MAVSYRDLVMEFSYTTGTGPLTLAGTTNGFRTALTAWGPGDHESHWAIRHPANGQWEVFRGTVNGTGLTRDETLSSSNGGLPVDFSPGRKEVRCTFPAELATILQQQADGTILADGSVPFEADQSMGGNQLTNVGDPVDAQDAATKAYVDENATVGPVSSTDRAIATWNGEDGDSLRDNPDWTISANGKMAGKSSYSPIVTVADAATINIDWNAGRWFKTTLGGNRTLTVSNVSVGQMVKLQLVQDGTGSRTVTWPSGVTWPGGTEPTLTVTATRWDNFTLACYGVDGYGNPLFEGYVNGLNFGA